MEQQFMMEPATAQQFERIVNKLEKTNYGEGFRNKIAEKMAAGIKEFVIPADAPMYFGGDRLDLQAVIGTIKDDPGKSVLKGIDASLTKEIKIPAVVLQEQGAGNILVNVPNLDQRLSHPPTSKTLGPGLHEELGAMKKKYSEEINRDMQLLMHKAPDLFNLLQAKHNTSLTFTVPPEYLSQQAKIVAESHLQNTFSSYFNLTPIEIYGMLKNGLPVHKTLFTTKQDQASGQQQGSQQFTKWIKLNFNERRLDGSYKVDFIQTKEGAFISDALKRYNFLELDNDLGRKNIIYHLRKAGLIEVTNGNPVGEKKLLIAADPGYQMKLKLFTQDGAIIYNHNDYLKVGLKKEVGEVISLPVVDYRRRQGNTNNEQPQSARPLKTLVVNMEGDSHAVTTTPQEQLTRRNTGGRKVDKGKDQSKQAI